MFRVMGYYPAEIGGRLVEVFPIEFDKPETEVGFRLLRSERDRLLKLFLCLLRALKSCESHPQSTMTGCIVGAGFHVTGELLARILEFPFPKKRASQAIESHWIALPQLQCLLESCDRVLPQRQSERYRPEFELNIGIVGRIVAGLS